VRRLFPLSLVALVLVFTGTLPAFSADPSSARNVVPFHLYGGHMIVLKCSVGGLGDLTAIVDTGTSETVLDVEVARKLSLAVEPDSATFINQQAKVWAVDLPRLEFGSVAVEHLHGIATDLSSLTAELGIRPQVLIGMDVLRRSSFLIDYRSHRLVFGPVPRLAHSAPFVSLVPGESSLRFVVIESTILGHRFRLQVDSGFEGVLLYRDQLPISPGDRMSATSPAHGQSNVANLGQTLLARSLSPPDVQIGVWHAPHAQLTVVDGTSPESAEFDGLIGAAFLSKGRVAFDFENGMISWE
jgi:predicted aspartyl protease